MKKYVVINVDLLNDLHQHVSEGNDWVPVAQILDLAAKLPGTEPTDEEKTQADVLIEDFKSLIQAVVVTYPFVL